MFTFTVAVASFVAGVMYAPVFKPLILKAWRKIQAFLNTPRE
jgi:hypothetical protein